MFSATQAQVPAALERQPDGRDGNTTHDVQGLGTTGVTAHNVGAGGWLVGCDCSREGQEAILSKKSRIVAERNRRGASVRKGENPMLMLTRSSNATAAKYMYSTGQWMAM